MTVAALAIPSAMAYAELAGLSPVAGLYALLLPAVAYAFLGSSRQLVVGPEGALSLLVAVSVAPLAAGNPSLTGSPANVGVVSADFPAGTYVVSGAGTSTLTLSQAATATGSASAVFTGVPAVTSVGSSQN